MGDILTFLTLFISTILAVLLLGLIAGFSPTLYLTQVTLETKTSKKISAYTIGLVSGVVAAIIFLIILFQVVQPSVLRYFIDTTIHTVMVSMVFNCLIGLILIVGGALYLHQRKQPRHPKKQTLKQAGGMTAIVSFGFVRTLTSVSGIGATFIAASLIAGASSNLIEEGIYTAVFLAAAIAPFGGIVVIMRKNPRALTNASHHITVLLHRMNYQQVLGIAAIIVGCCIIAINLIPFLF